MGYFSNYYDCVRYPIQTDKQKGLRRAQIGAIHAIASHFTRFDSEEFSEPALVVMPTGSGKTAVLMLSPFVLQANRILVVTPSKLVREQVTMKFNTLDDLIEQDVLTCEPDFPRVCLVENRLDDEVKWHDLENFDVVVSTPKCVSPGQSGITTPPEDMFDLLLIDEAHHEPAKTWRAILEAFPRAKKVLFTATPYRQDKHEIRGRIIYDFPIEQAYKDGIFGDLSFVPVSLNSGSSISKDVAIALKAQEVFSEDRDDGYDHYIMVRTDAKTHASQLAEVYKEHTGLNLRVVHSGHTAKHITWVIKQLREKKLDGIICVDMLGEGFDFPELKIAAIHERHKSLPVTLQFVGRFARTNAENLGAAKFIAVPETIGEDIVALFKSDAVWQTLIPSFYQSRIEEELRQRRAVESFTPKYLRYTADENIDSISIYSLQPFHHVKIYEILTNAIWNFDVDIELEGMEIVRQEISGDLSCMILISREEKIPKWTDSTALARVEYDLFVVYMDHENQLLFINSSRKSETIYRSIASQIISGSFRPLPMGLINKVLIDLEDAEFFNIGMRNRLLNSQTESYRIITGANAHNAVNSSDGKFYHRGHVFGRGGPVGNKETIGFSSAAKVWSNTSPPLPGIFGLVRWCKTLARRIRDVRNVVTSSGLDFLPVGESIDSLPDGIYCADWDPRVYRRSFQFEFSQEISVGHILRGALLDVDLKIDWAFYNDEYLRVRLIGPVFEVSIAYSPEQYPYYEAASPNVEDLHIVQGTNRISLLDFLNEYPLQFHTVNQALITGDEIIQRDDKFSPFSQDEIEVVNWEQEGVDIQQEYGQPEDTALISIHDYLMEILPNNAESVFYDHGTGEVADFIAFTKTQDDFLVTLIHVKAAGGSEPGERVNDVYELCGQAVKSLIWCDKDRLLRKMQERMRGSRATASRFLAPTDNLDILVEHWEEANRIPLPTRYEIAIVQPGITARSVPEKTANVLASTRDFVIRSGGIDRFYVIGSA